MKTKAKSKSKSAPAPTTTRAKSSHWLGAMVFTLSGLMVAFWLSWHGLAQVNFAYPQAYRMLDIEAHIQHYAPQNRYKKGFAFTEPEQHYHLFAEIVKAIQQGGSDLAQIQYQLPSNSKVKLLTQAEVVHLQDVANLIGLFNQVALGALITLVGYLILYRWQRKPAPPWWQPLSSITILSLICAMVLLGFGAEASFYWLHTQIFPDDHQWFFYYQESLMTTLMKAPDLFGFIAAIWAVLAILMFIALFRASQLLLNSRARSQP